MQRRQKLKQFVSRIQLSLSHPAKVNTKFYVVQSKPSDGQFQTFSGIKEKVGVGPGIICQKNRTGKRAKNHHQFSTRHHQFSRHSSR